MKVAIFYGSSTGNTKAIANQINNAIGNVADVKSVDGASSEDLNAYDFLFLGTSTWGIGDLQDDWDSFLSDLKSADLQNKTIALFGLGDSMGYPDSFIDGVGTLYDAVLEKGCKVVGQVSVEGYNFESSTAVKEGVFVGLPIDEDNESSKTSDRIATWIESIKTHLS